MTLSRRGFLTALVSAPVAATLPVPPVVRSDKAAQAAQLLVVGTAHGPLQAEPFEMVTGQALRPPFPRAVDVLAPARQLIAIEAPQPSEPDMTLIEYLNSINGQPWSEDRHCLVLAAEIQRRFFGRELPLPVLPKSPGERHAAIHTDPVRQEWRQVEKPEHGAIVLMSPRADNRIDCHIGVCLVAPEPIVAHSDRPQGVCVDDLMTLGVRGWHPTFWMPV